MWGRHLSSLCICASVTCSTAPLSPPYLEKHTHSSAWLPARPSQSTVVICVCVTVTQNSLLFSWFTVFGSWIQLNKQWTVSQAAMATEVSGCLFGISGQSAVVDQHINLMCWSFALRKTFFGISQDLSMKVTRIWRVELLANWTLLFVIPKNKLQDELWQVSFCTHFQIITCWMPLKQKMNHQKKERQ